MFRNNSFIKVHELSQHQSQTGKSINVRASSQSKQPDGTYVYDWDGFVVLSGTAKAAYEQAAAQGNPKPLIKITDCGVKSTYDKAKNITYTNYFVFGGEYVAPKNPVQAPVPAPAPVVQQAPFGNFAPAQTPVAPTPVQQAPFGNFAPAQTPVASAPAPFQMTPPAPQVAPQPAPQPAPQAVPQMETPMQQAPTFTDPFTPNGASPLPFN